MDNNESFYSIDSQTGEITINPEDYNHLKWQFQQAGVDIAKIHTEAQFKDAYDRSRDYVDEAFLRTVSQMENRYAREAFEVLIIEGDTEAFERLGKKAEVYGRMKRNSITN